MTRATPPKAAPHPDAAILCAWSEFVKITKERDALPELGTKEDDEIRRLFFERAFKVEKGIIETPAFTIDGLAARLRSYLLSSEVDVDVWTAVIYGGPEPKSLDDGDYRGRFIWSILKDAERIAKPRRLKPLAKTDAKNRLTTTLHTMPDEVLRGIMACLKASVALSKARRDYWNVMRVNGADRLPSSIRERLEDDERAVWTNNNGTSTTPAAEGVTVIAGAEGQSPWSHYASMTTVEERWIVPDAATNHLFTPLYTGAPWVDKGCVTDGGAVLTKVVNGLPTASQYLLLGQQYYFSSAIAGEGITVTYSAGNAQTTVAVGYSGFALVAAANYSLNGNASLPNLNFEVFGPFSNSVPGSVDADPGLAVADLLTHRRRPPGRDRDRRPRHRLVRHPGPFRLAGAGDGAHRQRRRHHHAGDGGLPPLGLRGDRAADADGLPTQLQRRPRRRRDADPVRAAGAAHRRRP